MTRSTLRRARRCVLAMLSCLAACGSAVGAGAPPATSAAPSASSDSEVLLALFQRKGLITDQEAREAREALAARHTISAEPAPSKVSALPEWVSGVRVAADFRARFEENNAEDAGFVTRDRYRYRLRLGAVVSLVDGFDLGVRFGSGNPLFNPGGALVGGSPITANQDFNSLESRKFFWIDAAYARWTPVKSDTARLGATVGKMDNPFALSPMVWDADISPEGGALQFEQKLDARHTLRAITAFFVLDELNQAVTALPGASPKHDPAVYGGQLMLESKWTGDFETAVGLAGFEILHKDTLSARLQPFYNAGNSRDATTGILKYEMTPLIGSMAATWKFAGVPLYPGAFPVRLAAEYMKNSAAPAQNRAYRLGATLGRAGRQHAWELNYRYQRLEADAWFDALVDDDNGGYYVGGNAQLAGTGKATGWFGGTNVKGHWVQATYSITDYLNLTVMCYWNKLIVNSATGSSEAGHIFTDLMWRF